jgi:hypothetical protein
VSVPPRAVGAGRGIGGTATGGPLEHAYAHDAVARLAAALPATP